MITPCPLEICKSVVEFFERGGAVEEIPRPAECSFAECGLRKPLWRNGSYLRQVIYWGFFFMVSIMRFRCRRCGKTVSRPYGWLVPYRRFSVEVIAAGIEAYASGEWTYHDLGVELSELEFVEPEMDVRKYRRYQEAGAVRVEGEGDNEVSRPVASTVFHWVDFACKRIEELLQQVQKELVRRGKQVEFLPLESAVENPNSYKAYAEGKGSMLDRLSFLTFASELLVGCGKRVWERLRAYFLTAAESCKDLLTDTHVRLSTTQTFELAIF